MPRQRLLCVYLDRHALPIPGTRVLHVAPEPALATRLRGRPGVDYVSVDLEAGRAGVQADLTALPFPDETFRLALCSHVLEHIRDDRAAMAELHRVLEPGGLALVQSPVNYDQRGTYEDPRVGDPDERRARFSQEDHVRVYGPDLRERLEAGGFAVTVVDAAGMAARYGLAVGAGPLRNDLYVCERGPSGSAAEPRR